MKITRSLNRHGLAVAFVVLGMLGSVAQARVAPPSAVDDSYQRVKPILQVLEGGTAAFLDLDNLSSDQHLDEKYRDAFWAAVNDVAGSMTEQEANSLLSTRPETAAQWMERLVADYRLNRERHQALESAYGIGAMNFSTRGGFKLAAHGEHISEEYRLAWEFRMFVVGARNYFDTGALHRIPGEVDPRIYRWRVELGTAGIVFPHYVMYCVSKQMRSQSPRAAQELLATLEILKEANDKARPDTSEAEFGTWCKYLATGSMSTTFEANLELLRSEPGFNGTTALILVTEIAKVRERRARQKGGGGPPE